MTGDLSRFGRDAPRGQQPPQVRTDPVKQTVSIPPVLMREVRAFCDRAALERGWVSVSLQDVAVTLLQQLAEDEDLQARVIGKLAGRRRSVGP